MALRKTYKANSVISFPITYSGGYYKRIKFLPYSFGGSIYVTADEELQTLLESHPYFGKRYTLMLVEGESNKVEEEVAEPVKELTKVEVNDIAEAKQYLVDNYGVAKAKLRSTASIKAVAEQNGIEFVIA